ncbi:unnamed protein product [Caenorhabditis auriculariae]|uniref:Major facilitator superfamily (MFS) profile domain-containing protein n=1 Tax=Caenorhabditis auriculariae TaxID=2777116 RepID=A0A8S1GNA5_9PELO|nr:unnamed protein product [Caenorhabditis auriculariae]
MASPLLPQKTLQQQIFQSNFIPPFWSLKSLRFEMALLISSSMVVMSLMRNAMSMAMVAIVKNNVTSVDDQDEFTMDWTGDEQARIHTAFYVGALLAVFPSEAITQRIGAKNLLSLSMLINILGSFLTPLLAIFLRNYLFVAGIRLVMGVGNGFIIPCGSVVISKWFPINEKSTAMAIFTTGNQLGIAASMLLTAKFCEVDFFGGWPLAFFAFGVFGTGFLLIWHFRAADKPRNSQFITAVELEYIHGGKARRRRANTVIRPTPYLKILLNGCVNAICLCSFAQSFVLVALVTYLPKYYQIAMNMNLSKNGIWSAVPFASQMITKLVFGIAADRIKQRKVSVTIVTKASNAIASFGTAACILIVCLLPIEQTELIMFFMCSSMALFSAYVPGYNTSIVSVAPQFTAFISSYAQIYSQMASTLAPLVIGLLTKNGTVEEWNISFYMLVCVLVFTGLAFQIFGHGRTEPWGETPSNATSVNLSTCLSTNPEDGSRRLSLDRHNSILRSDSGNNEPRKKKISRVSYKDDDVVMLPSRMEDLENDVIYSIEEEHED